MSANLNAFLNDVKRAAVEAVLAGKPFSFTLGQVKSVSPLKIQVDQKLELTAAQLILTNAVRDYTVSMTIDHTTEEVVKEPEPPPITEHTHYYKGTKKFRVHLALKAGETVLLLRADGGQKYIVLDRVEALQ